MDHKLATPAFVQEKLSLLQFYNDLTGKIHFSRDALVQVQKFGIGTMYGFEILHQCGKRFETKSQKVMGTNSYLSRHVTQCGCVLYVKNQSFCSEKKLNLIQMPFSRSEKILLQKKLTSENAINKI